MTDLMDERLAATARRWQADQPAPPSVPLERLGPVVRGQRPRRLVLTAAAAAAVLVAGTLAVLLTGHHGSGTSAPTSHRTIETHRFGPHDVPWRALPARHPQVRHREHGRIVTPFDDIAALGHISGAARPGDIMVFEVTLVAPTRVSLDPCPDYEVAFGAHSFHQGRLNCAQVPYRDSHGRPFLPAQKKVRFLMQLTVPDEPGRQKVLWTILGPQSMPGFYGIVKVESPAAP